MARSNWVVSRFCNSLLAPPSGLSGAEVGWIVISLEKVSPTIFSLLETSPMPYSLWSTLNPDCQVF